MTKEEINNLTVEELFEVRRITAEETIRLYDECKKTTQFFIDKTRFIFSSEMSDHTLFDVLVDLMKGEIWNLKNKIDLLTKAQPDYLLPSIPRPNFHVLDEQWKYIYELRMVSDIDQKNFENLKLLIRDTCTSLMTLEAMFVFDARSVEEIFNQLLDKYKQEHKDGLNYYLEEYETVETAKTVLREEYKDYVAVKCWKEAAHNVGKTLFEMRKRGAVEADLLPLFDYIAKFEMLQETSKWQKFTSAINEALKPKKKRQQNAPVVNVYGSNLSISNAQDVIAEGGTKNVYNSMQ